MASGCGVLLDLDRPDPDAGLRDSDAGPVMDAGDVDAALPDAGADMDSGSSDAGVEDAGFADASADAAGVLDATILPADASALDCSFRTELFPSNGLSMRHMTPCGPIEFGWRGSHAAGSPGIVPSSAGTEPSPVILFVSNGTWASLEIQYPADVEVELSFRFEWLSYDPGRAYDERLQVVVDGAFVTPTLSDAVNTRMVGNTVHSSVRKGDGTITVHGTVFEIQLQNHDAGHGQGIELHSFRARAL